MLLREVSFLSKCGVTYHQIPKQIPWASASDVALIEAAVENQNAGPLGTLEKLRELLIDELDRAHLIGRVHRRTVSTGVRVLYASNPSAYSGGEQCLVNTIRSVRDRGVEAHCLVALEGIFSERLRASGAVVHCPQGDFASPTVPNFVEIGKLLNLIRPDIIHCNAIVGAPVLALSRLKRIPLAQWLRLKSLDTQHLLSADCVTAVSRFVADRACEELIRPQKIRVLYDAVDCDHFSPECLPPRNVRRELGIAPGDFLILCLARFAPYKRHDVLAEAVSILLKSHCAVHLVLVGEPEQGREDHYTSFIRRLRDWNLVDATTILGFQDDVLSFEAAADAVVLCSEEEPLGTVVLESMALARPVVVAASGGLPEMIEDEVSGLHSAPGDPVSLARQLDRLIRNRALACDLGAHARTRALQQFSLATHARNVLSIYDELLSDPVEIRRAVQPDQRPQSMDSLIPAGQGDRTALSPADTESP